MNYSTQLNFRRLDVKRTPPAMLLLALTAFSGWAAEPASQDVTIPTTAGEVVVLEWTGTAQPGAIGAGTNTCDLPGSEGFYDTHTINLGVPAGAYDAIALSATFRIEWETAGSDLVLSVIKDGSTAGSSDGGSPFEEVSLQNPAAGVFEAVACAFAAAEQTPYRGRLTLSATSKDADNSPVAGTGNAAGLAPRFHNYAPDYAAQGFGMFGGEATVDVNSNTGSIFYLGFLETMRLQLDDSTSPAQQTWELKSGTLNSQATSDPILVADRATGRVFAQQLIVGEGNSLTEYSDDDGESWQPSQGGGFRSGADHQSLGVGPYPVEGNGALIPHPLYPNAVYYCSQDVALVFCSRSDDGGVTFGAGVPIYTLADCQGLHGHIKVSGDGIVYVPISGCPSGLVDAANSRPAIAVSEDAGVTWEIRPVNTAALGSGGHGSDPSIGIASDNSIYMGYVSALDNHMHMVRSVDRGLSWQDDVDLGALAGLTAAEFPAAVAGDPDRAAVAFFATTYTGDGDPNGEAFPGAWHLYVASTFDQGKTYHVTNASVDPIQRGGLCSGGFCRNLLDFFDAVIDEEGRILVGYEDGCIGGCGAGSHPTFSDQTVIARQSGGPRLLAAFDPVEPRVPGAPRIEGYRSNDFAVIEWPATDDGGSAVQSYQVYRGTSANALSLHASVGNKTSLLDLGLNPGLTYYYEVSAVNAQGEGARGNQLALAENANRPRLADACTLPGRLMAIDQLGESEARSGGRDLTEVFVAEPEDQPGMLAVTLATEIALPPDQNGSSFSVYFDVAPNRDRFRLNLTAGSSSLERLIPDPGTGNLDGSEDLGPLDGASYGSDGAVTLVVDKARLGVDNGDVLLQVYAETTPGASGSNVLTEEAGYFDYRIQGNDFCANGFVIAPPGDSGPAPTPVPTTPPNPAPINDGSGFGRGGSLGWLGLALLLCGSARRRRPA